MLSYWTRSVSAHRGRLSSRLARPGHRTMARRERLCFRLAAIFEGQVRGAPTRSQKRQPRNLVRQLCRALEVSRLQALGVSYQSVQRWGLGLCGRSCGRSIQRINKCVATYPLHKRSIRFIGPNRELCLISKGRKFVGKFPENRIY
jgi:hypothetical protein